MDVRIVALGKHRGAPRVWIEGLSAQKSGFLPGCRYDISVGRDRVSLTLEEEGSRKVSAKRKAGSIRPVIDINNSDVLKPFAGSGQLKVEFRDRKITISRLASEQRARERLSRLREKMRTGAAVLTGSVASGIGVLTHAEHTGLNDAFRKIGLPIKRRKVPSL